MKYRRLFIDKISKDFSPDLDLALGPWCFNGMFSLAIYDEIFCIEGSTSE